MTDDETTTIRREITVPTGIERAYAVFTGRFGEIKPSEHTLLGVPVAATVFENRVGGGIVDRGVDGSECRWARILVLEPPTRLVFTWDITTTWEVETDPAHTSEVEIRFVALGPASTRVELEHRHLDRHGPGWQGFRDGIDADNGWPLYLERYAAMTAPTG